MYYFSQVAIDTNNRQKLQDLTHLGAYHNWVEQSFPEEIANQERRRHLWRIDKVNGHHYLLVLSQDKPDLKKLEHYGIPQTAQTKEYTQFIDRLHEGDILRFKLTANPSYRSNGRIYPHVTVTQQKQWFQDRVTKWGFSVTYNNQPTFDITHRDYAKLYHEREIKLSRCTFEGILKITDLAQFKHTLTHGVGREKAYGMGLLTVIPMKPFIQR